MRRLPASQWLVARLWLVELLCCTLAPLVFQVHLPTRLLNCWQELRDELELRGLDPSGLKAALVERLEAALASDGAAPSVAANGAATNGAPAQPAPAAEVPAAATKGRQVRTTFCTCMTARRHLACHKGRWRKKCSRSCATKHMYGRRRAELGTSLVLSCSQHQIRVYKS